MSGVIGEEKTKASVRRLPMTDRAAFAEAKRRWGNRAAVSRNDRATLQPEKDLIRTLYAGLQLPRTLRGHVLAYRCTVGEVFIGLLVKGEGDTWEEAFAKVRP